MTTKHTPAPWLVDGADTNWTVYGLNDQGYNRFSAQIQRGNTAPMEHTGSDEIAANARLIAAAPELLDLLDALECDINTLVYCYERKPDNFGRAVAIAKADAERARALISKARGAQ